MFNLRTQRRHAWWWDSATPEGALSWLNTAQDICWSWGLPAGKTPINWTKLFYVSRCLVTHSGCFPTLNQSTKTWGLFLPSRQNYILVPEGSHVSLPPGYMYVCPVYWPMGKAPRAAERCVQWGCGGWGSLLGAVFTSNVPCGLLDGAFGNKGRVFSITRLQGLFQFLCCGEKGSKKKMKARCSGSMPCLATQNSSNAVLLRKLCDFSRHSTMHYFLISPVISSAKQLCKL